MLRCVDGRNAYEIRPDAQWNVEAKHGTRSRKGSLQRAPQFASTPRSILGRRAGEAAWQVAVCSRCETLTQHTAYGTQ